MNEQKNNSGKLIVISGPSGVGKSTITKQVVKRTDAFLSVSATTRPKADSETDGKEYWFLTEDQFSEKLRNDEFLEYAEVFGNFYGTPRDKVDLSLAQGRNVLLEIDVQGARKVKKIYPDAILVFILPPSQADLAKRMAARARGEDSKTESIRLDGASREIAAAWQYYDHLVINDDLEQAIKEVIDIIEGNTGETI